MGISFYLPSIAALIKYACFFAFTVERMIVFIYESLFKLMTDI